MSCLTLTCFILLSTTAGDTQSDSVADSREWRRSKSSVGLIQGDNVVWQFNYGTDLNTPYFDPVATTDGRVLSWDRPPDHAWHHGVWFCWKFINGVNYWEHVGQTRKPEGKTDWSDVKVQTREDHSAVISMTLRYHPANDGEVVLVERRRIKLSAPNDEGVYAMDWTCSFTAGDKDVTLDRTPPKEKSWGGYAGLSIRFAKDLADRQTHDTNGLVEFGEGGRHRTRAVAMDYSGVIDGMPVGLAFLDHPDNPRYPTRWYAIRDPVMGYINAALLNDDPLVIGSSQQLTLRYRMIVHPNRWGADRLRMECEHFKSTESPKLSE